MLTKRSFGRLCKSFHVFSMAVDITFVIRYKAWKRNVYKFLKREYKSCLYKIVAQLMTRFQIFPLSNFGQMFFDYSIVGLFYTLMQTTRKWNTPSQIRHVSI